MTVIRSAKDLIASVVQRSRSGAGAAYAAAMTCSLLAVLSLAIYGIQFDARILATYFIGMAVAELVVSIANMGVTQFVQKIVPGSSCRGKSLFARALGIRLLLTLAAGTVAAAALAVAPIHVSVTIKVTVMVLCLSVASGAVRLMADFLESAGILVGAQLVRGAGGLFRLVGVACILGGVLPLSIETLLFLEIFACLVSGVGAAGYLFFRVWPVRGGSRMEISWSELIAFGANDWSYLLQSAPAVRLASSFFVGEAMVTLLSLAQSVLSPVTRYMPAVLLRGLWMSRSALAYRTGPSELASVVRLARRANSAFAVAIVPLALVCGAAYLSYATGVSILMTFCLSTLLIATSVLTSYRVLKEISLQVTGFGGLVAKAALAASVVGILFGLAGRNSVLGWAAVGLVASATWWLIIPKSIGGIREGGL